MLKPLDILFGLKAHLWSEAPWSYGVIAASIGASASQGHAGLRRLEEGGLYRSGDRSLRVHAFIGFATHGIPVVFPARVAEAAVGMPTAHAAPPLSNRLVFAEAYVWPTGSGIEGRAVVPLHPVVPGASLADPKLYAALALIDALRLGRARDRRLAVEELERLLIEPARDATWLVAQRAATVAI